MRIKIHAMVSPLTSTDSWTCSSANDESESSDFGFLKSLNLSDEETKHFPIDKLKEYNREKDEANLAYKNFMISELILNTYKELVDTNSQISPEAVKFVKDTISIDHLQNCAKMKSRNGNTSVLLGLDDSFTNKECKLSALDQSQLRMKVFENLEKKIEELKDKMTNIQEAFGAKAKPSNGHHQIVDQEGAHLEKYLEPFIRLSERIEYNSLLLSEIGEMMAELPYLLNNNNQTQKIMDSSVVLSMIKILNCTISILKEKLELFIRKNKNHMKYLNTLGGELKKRVDSLRETAYYLKAELDKYERKEEHSVVFRDLVKKYNQKQKELKHKTHTLSILNQPDTDDL